MAPLRSQVALLPRPPFDPSAYLPDFHDELRWPLSPTSHPSLEPRFAIAQALAQPGVGWIDLCGLGAQNRYGGNKDVLSYLRGWCNAIKGDVDAACTHLVPLVGSTTRGMTDAVKIDLSNILADQGDAEKAEHWINRHHIRDVEVLDRLAANYVEVGTVRDAATINRLAMDTDDQATMATRCTRMTRQIALAGNPSNVMIDAVKQLATSKGKIADPTCEKLVHKLECWTANGTHECDAYWHDVGIDTDVSTMIWLYRSWPRARTYEDWRRLADSATLVVRLPGAAAFALSAMDNAIREAGFCSENIKEWLDYNEVMFRISRANAPEVDAHYKQLVDRCRL
ncbi:MAG: hypothetical protein HOV81_09185 [Kofleriaceae bacterium]|nr:hypothetical protein [Kofleriaceae bacterium]